MSQEAVEFWTGHALRHHSKRNVALEGAAGCRYFDCAGGCANWHSGANCGIRDDHEICGRAVEGNAGCAAQIVTEDNDFCSGLAEGRPCFDEWAKPEGQIEHCATAINAIGAAAARVGCPVETPIGPLRQPRSRCTSQGAVRLGAKAVERRQRAAWCELEDTAPTVGAPTVRGAVDIAVGGLYQPLRIHSVCTAFEAKVVESGQLSGQSNFEQGAIKTGSP